MEKILVDDSITENNVQSSFWDFKGKYEFVDHWFLMGTPYPLLAITVPYLLFVLKLGPEYLKNRRPFQLKNVLMLYNMFQVVLSAVMVTVVSIEARKVGLIQRTCLTDTYESQHRLATLTYYYFCCKITELLDTVFFVLRKKQKQVTFLHVYHHTLMVWNGWVFLKYEPGYWMLFLGLLNCFVHVIMYTYYGLSAYPSLHKYLWWKKYITTLQLAQFGLIIIQVTISLFVNECKPSRATVFYLYFNLLLFIYLFSSFYKKSYSKENEKGINSPDINKIKLNESKTHVNNNKINRNGDSKNGDYFSNGLQNQTNEAIDGSKDFSIRAKTKIKRN